MSVVPLSMRFFRTGIHVSKLEECAKKWLESGSNIEDLGKRLGWENQEDMDYLRGGILPQKDSGKLLNLMNGLKKQRGLRERRKNLGYEGFTEKRKGWLGGWWQGMLDRKELSHPIGADVMEWLNASKRLGVLIALHDALLGDVAVEADPLEVGFEEMGVFVNPLCEMIANLDMERAKELVRALSVSLEKVDVSFLIEGVVGYSVYRPQRGVAYYYQVM